MTKVSSRITAGAILLAAVTFAALLLIAYWANFAWRQGYVISSSQSDWGDFSGFFGDLFGPVVALVALAFAAKSYVMQRDASEEARGQQQLQIEILTRERSESRFFELLAMYERSLDSISFGSDVTNRSSALHGKAAITALLAKNFGDVHKIDMSQRLAAERVQSLMHASDGNLGSYYRTIYTVLSAGGSILGASKFEFMKLFRVQLSSDEVALIALAAMDPKRDKLLALVARYGLLKHLRPGVLRDAAEMGLPSECFGRKHQSPRVRSRDI